MEDWKEVLIISIIFMTITSFISYGIGLEHGRNDGFEVKVRSILENSPTMMYRFCNRLSYNNKLNETINKFDECINTCNNTLNLLKNIKE